MNLIVTAAASVKWNAATNGILSAMQLVKLIILTHVLGPKEFGLMAMVMLVVESMEAYTDFGVSAAIIQRRDATADQLSGLYWINVLCGFFLFFTVLLLTPVFVLIFNEPLLTPILRWSALTLVITSWGKQYDVLLQKALLFKELCYIRALSSFIGTIVTLASAFHGDGVWSLVWGHLCFTLFQSLLLVWRGRRHHLPRLHFQKMDLSGYWSFGLYQMGEKAINFLNTNLDKLIIGSLLGAHPLGIYSLAWNIVIQPISKINPIITGVAFPIFSMIQSEAHELRKGYLAILKFLSSINFPLLLGLSAVAPLFVEVFFDSNWMPVVIPLQVLAIVALLRSQGNPVGTLLLAKGRADIGFKWNLVLSFTQVTAIYFACATFGLNGVAFALLILQVLYVYPSFYFLVRPFVDCSFNRFVSSMSYPFLFAVIMAAFVHLFPKLLICRKECLLVGQILVGVSVYACLNLIFQRHYWLELSRLVLGRRA